MDPNELQIGNWVQVLKYDSIEIDHYDTVEIISKEINYYVQVTSILRDGINFNPSHPLIPDHDYFDIQGIFIDDDSFSQIEEHCRLRDLNPFPQKIKIFRKGSVCCLTYDNFLIPVDCLYIHQIQNLFFALTNSFLELQPKKPS